MAVELGELLVAHQKLTDADLQRARRVQDSTGEGLDTLLLKLGLVSERDVSEALVAQLELPLVRPTDYPEMPVTNGAIAPRFLKEARAIPLFEDERGLTVALANPTDLLFGVQLGGGTDIGRALQYCLHTIQRPQDTILVLLSDLFEGADPRLLHETARQLHQRGVHLICLLALDDEGTPAYHREHAAFFASLGCPVFASTPDRFPDLMAAAVEA